MHPEQLRAQAKAKRIEADALEAVCAFTGASERADKRRQVSTLRRKAAELEMAAQRKEAVGI
jgi:hypothetical protein